MIDADISFGKIHFKPFNTLVIKDVAIIDKAPFRVDTLACGADASAKFCRIAHDPVDTLFAASDIVARFSLGGLLGNGIRLRSAVVSDAAMNLVIEEGDYTSNITRMFRIRKNEPKPDNGKLIFRIRDIEIDGMRFTMKDYTARHTHLFDKGIDWYDLDVRDIDIRGRDLQLKGKIMSGELAGLSFAEKSGYVCTSLSGSASVGKGLAEIKDLHLVDLWSDIYVSKFNMRYDSAADFADFTEKVRMEGEIGRSAVNFMSLGYFAPALGGKDIALDAAGQISGTVENLNVENLDFSVVNTGVSGRIAGKITGLPDTEHMGLAVSMRDFIFTTRGIGKIMQAWGVSGFDPGAYAENVRFRMNASIDGRMDDMRIKAAANSPAGRVNTEMKVLGLTTAGRSTHIAGNIGTSDLHIRKIIPKVPVGPVTMAARLNADFGAETSVKIDSMKVSRLNFNDYDYTGIAAAGTFVNNRFDGKVIANDPNLNFLFQGIVSFSGKSDNSIYRFYANIGHADLNALKLDRRGRSELRLQTVANFSVSGPGEMTGDIEIGGIVLENEYGQYDIGDIRINSESRAGRYGIDFSSKFAEASFDGGASPAVFVKDLMSLTFRRELPAMFKDNGHEFSGHDYKLNFRTMNTMDLLAFAAPGTYIADNSSISAEISPDGLMTGKVKSQRIAFKEQYVKDFEYTFSNADNTLSSEGTGSEISIAAFKILNNNLEIFIDDDHIGASFTYDNSGDFENRGELVAFADVARADDGQPEYTIGLLPSSVYLNSNEWTILPSEAVIKGKEISVRNLEIRSGEQAITASGGVSESDRDTVSLHLDRFDISILNFLTSKNIDLKGAATGTLQITSPSEERGILADFICDSTSMGGTRIGNLELASRWNPDFRRFDISASSEIEGRRTVSVLGNYSNALKRLEIAAKLDSIDIGFAKPFLEDVFSEIGGRVSGTLTAEGQLDNLEIGSEDCHIDDVRLKVGYTNVAYTASGPFRTDALGVYFDDVTVSDDQGNEGSLKGKIGYDHFRNLNFDLGISTMRIKAVELDEKQGEYFYGKLFAAGDVSVTGPVEAVTLTADVATSRDGELHIPIPSSMNAGTTNLLKFKEFEEEEEEIDPYEEMMSRLKKQEAAKGDFAIRLRVSTDPQTEAFVEIDKASGNVLNGRGTGAFDLDIKPSSGLFDIKGDYTLSGGNYHFVALGIAARDFAINDGSNVRFNGDIMESTLNIDATYRTKASLSTLIADTSSVNNRRTVECGIKITDKLKNPRLSFSINVPDLDPMIKARVENALSTEDKVQKQFLSLLISNGFLPDEQSGIVNNSTVLLSNVSELMSNQLNNIFQKLDIPLDLGLNYQQNTRGDNIFDVAVSTQLFNNRVVVNGNIGNRQYRTGNSNSDVVGDIDIEIKLDRPGAFRLNLFSHSADQYTNYLDNSQRSGVGITYQQEFNKFGKFVRRIFMGRKKREAEELNSLLEAQNEEKVVITIEADENNEKKK